MGDDVTATYGTSCASNRRSNEYIKPIIDDVWNSVLSQFNWPLLLEWGKSSTHEKRVLRPIRQMAAKINGNMFQKNIMERHVYGTHEGNRVTTAYAH